MWLSKVTIQVCPSGGDLAATAAPTTLAPPGLLSTITCQPVWSVSLAWMMRATGSVEPPGGKGTMILTGPLGQSPAFCPRTKEGEAIAAALAAISERRWRTDMTREPPNTFSDRLQRISLAVGDGEGVA